MKLRVVLLGLAIGLAAFLVAPNVGAESLRIAPLQHQLELKKGEKKKGYADITNPSNEPVDVKLYVNGFSQVDTHGNLTFFDSEQIAKGLLLDYDSVTISPRQTLRLFFVADGTKLPSGDVFGVIFAETQPARQPGTVTTVRVGTLVMITNGTPGSRHAAISQLTIPFLQLGSTVGGTVTVANLAPKGGATGFFPQMTVELAPWGGKTEFKGPLVFAGNARTFTFEKPADLFGLYQVKVKANDAEKTALVFLVTGWWRLVLPVMIIMIVGIVIIIMKRRPRRRLRLGSEHK